MRFGLSFSHISINWINFYFLKNQDITAVEDSTFRRLVDFSFLLGILRKELFFAKFNIIGGTDASDFCSVITLQLFVKLLNKKKLLNFLHIFFCLLILIFELCGLSQRQL